MESIISQLSSQLKMNSNLPNKLAAARCLQNPELLKDIAANLSAKDKKLVGDCVEVFTETALIKPELITPFSMQLLPLIKHKETRVRWEAMHSIALISGIEPEFTESIISNIMEIIHKDGSVIVRDYATDAIINYASTEKAAADKAFPLLKEIFDIWGDRHAGRILEGMLKIYVPLTEYHNELKIIANTFKDSSRGNVRKLAAKIEKILNK